MGKFTRQETGIEGLCVIIPKIFEDERGYFLETYNKRDFAEIKITCDFVQDNQSYSSKGVIRGLHFQKKYPQSKLVRVIQGTVYDVAVDLRPGSPTFGNYFGVILSAENKKQFFIPKNFAHGFLVLSDTAEFAYKCDDFYHPNDEGGIIWNDPKVSIDWPLDQIGGASNLIFSGKDTAWSTISEFIRERIKKNK